MQISGNLLPLASDCSSCSGNQGLLEYRQSPSGRSPDGTLRNRQQTVEYVYEGEILEQVGADQQRQNRYAQSINPASQGAISSYVDTALASTQYAQRQGRLVDIFI